MKPIAQLTLQDVELLRKKGYGTNGTAVTLTHQEVRQMHQHLQTLYSGKIQMNFAEKIAYRNKAY